MSRRQFLRRFIPLEVAPRALVSRRVSVYIFIKIVEYMFANKNAMDFEKTYERETILPGIDIEFTTNIR